MARRDYRTLIDLGRRAGLRTSELYTAIVTRRPEVTESRSDQADSNGFIPGYDQSGHRVYRPIGDTARS